MLNKNRNRLWLECKKFLIIIIYILYKKKQENLKNIWIWDFLRFIWLYWCLNLKTDSNEIKDINYKKILGDFKSKIREYNNDDLFWTLKDSYKKQIDKNNSIYNDDTRKLDDILWENEDDFLKNDYNINNNIYDDNK